MIRIRWRHGLSPKRSLSGRSPAFRPTVDVLEDRCLMSTAYLQTNLVSDLPATARVTDPNLINPWGLAYSPTGPFWIGDNNAGVATLYNGQGQPQPGGSPLVVTIPPPAGGSPPAAPTGVVFNNTSGFVITAGAASGPSQFLFATEDGTIAGWNSKVNPTNAILAVDNSAKPTPDNGAVYKGLTLGTDSSGHPLLYATNFRAGTVDVFDQHFHATHLGSFRDPKIPDGFAPFGIQNLDGKIYVTYAKQNAAKHDDVAGAGNGFLDVFNTNGVLLRRFHSQGPLNSPWGLVRAPAGFGQFSHDVLVGNFGDGHINAFDPSNGHFKGQLSDAKGQPLTIDDLWGLKFGNNGSAGRSNTLFFTAGIGDEKHGLFGSLQAVHEKEDSADDADDQGSDAGRGDHSKESVSAANAANHGGTAHDNAVERSGGTAATDTGRDARNNVSPGRVGGGDAIHSRKGAGPSLDEFFALNLGW